MKSYRTLIALLFLGVGLASTALAQGLSSIPARRVTDLGGGTYRDENGTFFSDPSNGFVPSDSVVRSYNDIYAAPIFGTQAELRPVVGQIITQLQIWLLIQATNQGPQILAPFTRSSQTYTIAGAPYIILGNASTGGGSTTGVSSGGNNTTATASNPIRPTNISTRVTVQPGDSVTLGFVLSGDGQKNVLIRAVGPGLLPFGIPNVVANPSLTVYNSSGASIGANNGWSSDPTKSSTLTSAFGSVGAFALAAGSKDSALIVSLGAGAYTAQASAPVSGTAGDLLFEVYILTN